LEPFLEDLGGGEGVKKLLKARDMAEENWGYEWIHTVLVMKGRSFPSLPGFVLALWSVLTTLFTMLVCRFDIIMREDFGSQDPEAKAWQRDIYMYFKGLNVRLHFNAIGGPSWDKKLGPFHKALKMTCTTLVAAPRNCGDGRDALDNRHSGGHALLLGDLCILCNRLLWVARRWDMPDIDPPCKAGDCIILNITTTILAGSVRGDGRSSDFLACVSSEHRL
jgi:hypothetical protein